jgi:putative transposase
MHITYLPCKGFLNLVAVMDWYSRKILAWKLSNTLHAEFCVTALRESIVKHGIREIMNTEQGRQFTGLDFIRVLKEHENNISIAGKGCWRDSVFIDRFWRTVKYEEVSLLAYGCATDTRDHLTRYLQFYNQIRPRSALEGQTPHQVYFASIHPAAIAA